MGSMSSSPTVSLFFPLGMAIRHRASSPLLPSYSHLFASPFSLELGCIAVAVHGHIVGICRIVATRYGSIDAMTATQLLINTIRFSLPRDIGTPSRCTGTLEPRDIGTSSAQVGERAPTRGTVFFCSGTPLAVTGGLSAARFIAEPLKEVTTSWVVHVGCRYSFWSSFSRDSEGRGGPTAQVGADGSRVFHEQRLSSSEEG